jgi:LmbE family N-acetylglucosaminyl deacetylase
MSSQAPPPLPEIRSRPPAGRVVVVAPHPDDETFGCGGTLALHRAQGDPVRVIFLTDGAAGDPEGHYPPDRYVALRQAEARRAGAALGVTDLDFWALPDGKLSAVPDLEERLAAALDGDAPDLLYYPSAEEVHPDHWAAAAAVEALHRAGRLRSSAYAYEVWAPLRPTHLVDIGPVLERKRTAMGAYSSQLRYHDYRPKILGLNAYRALLLSTAPGHAEAFRQLA